MSLEGKKRGCAVWEASDEIKGLGSGCMYLKSSWSGCVSLESHKVTVVIARHHWMGFHYLDLVLHVGWWQNEMFCPCY